MNEDQIRLARVAAVSVVTGIPIGMYITRKAVQVQVRVNTKNRAMINQLRDMFEWGATTDPDDVGGREEWERIAQEKLDFLDWTSEL